MSQTHNNSLIKTMSQYIFYAIKNKMRWNDTSKIDVNVIISYFSLKNAPT